MLTSRRQTHDSLWWIYLLGYRGLQHLHTFQRHGADLLHGYDSSGYPPKTWATFHLGGRVTSLQVEIWVGKRNSQFDIMPLRFDERYRNIQIQETELRQGCRFTLGWQVSWSIITEYANCFLALPDILSREPFWDLTGHFMSGEKDNLCRTSFGHILLNFLMLDIFIFAGHVRRISRTLIINKLSFFCECCDWSTIPQIFPF